MDTDVILLNRLVSNMNLDLERDIQWNKGKPISIQEIELAWSQNVKEESMPFGHMHQKDPVEPRSNDYHIRRILYFMNHQDEIKNIELDNECVASYVLPQVVLIDGWHRLFAAIILKLEKIEVRYGGRTDLLQYLSGKTNEEPID